MAPRQRTGVLTPAETEALRSVVVHPRDRAAIGLMLDAGLRASEVVGLRLDQIDWQEQTLRFVGKGGKPAELPVSRRLHEALEHAVNKRPPQATHPYLIYDLRNPEKPITRYALLKLVKTYARKAGIRKRVFCHMLRHTFGTMFYRETGDLGRTQTAMRHTKIATTTIYMHLTSQDQREDFERIDTRPRLIRWWSRLKPRGMPRVRTGAPTPVFMGETIGRTHETALLRKGIRNRIHTVLVGERGVGRRHLLRQLEEGHDMYRMEVFSPARECLVTLCEMMATRGVLDEAPNGRSDRIFLQTLWRLGKERNLTLIIDSITETTKKERSNLQKLAGTWTIITSIDRNQQTKLGSVFFGNYQRIEVDNFDKATARLFTQKAMDNMTVPDPAAYLNHVYAQSQGNPQAILELVEATRKTGELTPGHMAIQRVLPASFFLAAFFMIGFVMRYSARSLSEPTLRIYALIFIVAVLVLMTFDKIMSMKAKG